MTLTYCGNFLVKSAFYWSKKEFSISVAYRFFKASSNFGVRVILGKNQLDYWILENPTNSKLEKWGCIPWIFYLLENVL